MVLSAHDADLLIILRFQEVRKHTVPAPAGIAQLLPVIEILAIATDVHHAMNDGRAAQHFATWPETTSAWPIEASMVFGLRVVFPIDFAVQKTGCHRRDLRAQRFVVTFLRKI